MQGAVHEPQWFEKSRKGDTVEFQCRVCNRRLTGSAKSYDAGKWFPSLGNHPNP